MTRVESTWEGSLEMVKPWRLGHPKERVGPERGMLAAPSHIYGVWARGWRAAE